MCSCSSGGKSSPGLGSAAPVINNLLLDVSSLPAGQHRVCICVCVRVCMFPCGHLRLSQAVSGVWMALDVCLIDGSARLNVG